MIYKNISPGIVFDEQRDKFILIGSPRMKRYPSSLRSGRDHPACGTPYKTEETKKKKK